MRKIVQIATNPHSQCVHAVCDDGSLWAYGLHGAWDRPAHWVRLPDIPQDQPQTKDAG